MGAFDDLIPSGSGGGGYDLKDEKIVDKTIDYQDKFNRRKEVAGYREVVPTLRSLINAPDNTAGDYAIVAGISKIFDPQGVIMQGDQERVEGTQPFMGGLLARAQAELSGETGRIGPSTRRQLQSVAAQRVAALASNYNTARRDTTNTATSLNLPAETIVGSHPGDDLVRNGLANRSGSGLQRAGTREEPWVVRSPRDVKNVPPGYWFVNQFNGKLYRKSGVAPDVPGDVADILKKYGGR